MTVTTRFAPSPTGTLHVGNIRPALQNWLLARKLGGRFMLRIDDTDAERSEERFVEAIRADLAWLGLEPDGEERQSERFDLYQVRFDALLAAGRVYPAYETAQELDLRRKIAAGRGLPPVYDRAALTLSDADRAKLESEGVRPHYRFKLDHDTPIEWDDLIRGHQKLDPATMSDPVIRRADGTWLYMLPSAIDDADMASAMSCAARIMSPTPRCNCRCSRRWGSHRRSSRTRPCWSAPKGSYRSGSVRSGSRHFVRTASSPKPSSRCSPGWGRAIRSNRWPTAPR